MRIPLLLIGATLAFAQQANAAVVINIIESGTDVEAALSGSLDLKATQGYISDSTGFDGYQAFGGNISFTSANSNYYGMNVDWTPFGPGGFGNWDTSSGDAWHMFSDPVIGVPVGYVSGADLSSSAAKFNSSFAALGFTPGSYVTTLTNGDFMDTVTVNIGVPAPGAMSLLGIGLLAAGRRRRG